MSRRSALTVLAALSGECIEVDTTDFAHVDCGAVTERLRLAIRQARDEQVSTI